MKGTSKAYQDLKAQFDSLEDNCQERKEQLAQAQQDPDEMADMVWQNKNRIATYKQQLKDKLTALKGLGHAILRQFQHRSN